MSTARDDILSNIRRSLGVTGAERLRNQAVEERLERAPKGVIPARGQVDAAARVDLFTLQAQGVQASVERVATPDNVPDAVARWLRERNLPATIRIGADPVLLAMPWEDTSIDVSSGPSAGGDLNAVSRAFAGVAETGTLALHSGGDNPTTLNFLPDNHIVVVKAADIVGDYESIWPRLRMAFGKGEMPRTVNLITGPSRSADIEQKLQLGAHGPRSLHIVIVD